MKRPRIAGRLRIATLGLLGAWIFCAFQWAQPLPAGPPWQQEVSRLARAQEWKAAMRIVDHEIAAAPGDMDIRAWRARVLLWSGELAEAAGGLLFPGTFSLPATAYDLAIAGSVAISARRREVADHEAAGAGGGDHAMKV